MRPNHTPEPVSLGEVHALVWGPELRNVRIDDVELIRRITWTARGARWENLPVQLVERDVTKTDSSLSIRSRSITRGERATVAFDAHVTLTRSALTVDVTSEVSAGSVLSRVGLCVLHPPTIAGTTLHLDTRGVRLEHTIAAQRIEDGIYYGAAGPYNHLAWDVDGWQVVHQFTGEEFELEDQRNWTDNSYKSYSPPLRTGWPRHWDTDQVQEQELNVSWAASESRSRRRATSGTGRSTVQIEGGQALGAPPQIGLRLPASASTASFARVAELGFHYVGVDLEGQTPAEVAPTIRALRAAVSQHVLGLELVLTQAQQLACATTPQRAPWERWVIVGAGAALPGHVSDVGGPDRCDGLCLGTRDSFVEINRKPDLLIHADSISWAISAQVHADDDISVLETVGALPAVVETARSLYPRRILRVNRLTVHPFASPSQVDPALERKYLMAAVPRLAGLGVGSVTVDTQLIDQPRANDFLVALVRNPAAPSH